MQENQYILPPIQQIHQDKITLVLDLDETLVHSSFDNIEDPDYVIPIFINGCFQNVFVLKRPYTDEFLNRVCELYEVVLFTASIEKYAGPLMDQLDTQKQVAHKLFRDSCTFYQQVYVKDLRRLGRDQKKVIIIDNAIPVTSWFDDKQDLELKLLLPILESLADVRIYTDTQYWPPSQYQIEKARNQIQIEQSIPKEVKSSEEVVKKLENETLKVQEPEKPKKQMRIHPKITINKNNTIIQKRLEADINSPLFQNQPTIQPEQQVQDQQIKKQQAIHSQKWN